MPALADKYGIDETLADSPGLGGTGLNGVMFTVLGAFVGLLVALRPNLQTGPCVIAGAVIGFGVDVLVNALV